MINLLMRWVGWPVNTKTPEPQWDGPQCFDSAAGTTMLAIHIAEATPYRRLS